MDNVKKQTLRAGVAQMFCRRSLQENLDQVLKMIGDVSDQGCDVAVFPESILRDLGGEASVSDFERAVESVKARARACNISVVKTGGKDAEILYFTAKTGSKNEWQASKNRTRKNGRGHDNWWRWLGQGVQAIYAGKK